jgi:hypothetical protein
VKRTFETSLLNNPMRTLLVLGAGRSTQSLIDYLLAHASDEDWMLTLADQNLEWATQKLQGHPRGQAVALDANDREKRRELIKGKFIVVSMLPAFMHPEIAEDCVDLGVHLATASYTSDAMRALGPKAAEKGLILLNEIGVDPGIDHLSAMKLLDEVRNQGAAWLGFESFTGGLLAPESPSNPWQYKLNMSTIIFDSSLLMVNLPFFLSYPQILELPIALPLFIDLFCPHFTLSLTFLDSSCAIDAIIANLNSLSFISVLILSFV